MLQTITLAPSTFNPKKHPTRLLARMNKLISKMKKTFPLQDKNLKQQKELPLI